ncbi:MAG: hypothetical protein OXC46_00790 [Thaumarchaeota archaeon]|nr:hypothetical protein [Nitrososphaerota archaeon]
MAKAKGTIELEVKSDRFNTGVQNIVGKLENIKGKVDGLKGSFSSLAGPASTLGGGLKSIGDGAALANRNMNTLAGTADRNAKSSFNNMANSTQRASQQAKQLGQNAGGATPKITGMGNAAQQAGSKMNTMGASAGKAAGSTGRFNAQTVGTAASIGTMGAGLVSLEASMSNYDKAAQKVEKAEQGMQKTRDLLQTNTIGLERAELKYEKALASGKKTEEELSLLENNRDLYRQKVSTATQELTIKEQDLNIAMMDQADTHKLMASSIATTLLGTISSAAGLLGNMNMQSLKNVKNLPILSKLLGTTGVTAGASATSIGTTSGAMTGMQGAGAKAGIGLRTVATGFKGLFVAMGPIGWAILGISSLWLAWETNFLGFRDGVHYIIDGMQQIWTWLEKILLPLQWLNDGLKAMGIDLGANLDAWQEEEKATRDAGEAYDDTKDSVVGFGEAHGTMQSDIAADTTQINTDIASVGTAHNKLQTDVSADAILINADVDSIGTHITGVETNADNLATNLTTKLAGESGAFNTISNAASTSLGGMTASFSTLIAQPEAFRSAVQEKFNSAKLEVGTALTAINSSFEAGSSAQIAAMDLTSAKMAEMVNELTAIGDHEGANKLKESWKQHAEYIGGPVMDTYKSFEGQLDSTQKKTSELKTEIAETQELMEGFDFDAAGNIIRIGTGPQSIVQRAQGLADSGVATLQDFINLGDAGGNLSTIMAIISSSNLGVDVAGAYYRSQVDNPDFATGGTPGDRVGTGTNVGRNGPSAQELALRKTLGKELKDIKAELAKPEIQNWLTDGELKTLKWPYVKPIGKESRYIRRSIDYHKPYLEKAQTRRADWDYAVEHKLFDEITSWEIKDAQSKNRLVDESKTYWWFYNWMQSDQGISEKSARIRLADKVADIRSSVFNFYTASADDKIAEADRKVDYLNLVTAAGEGSDALWTVINETGLTAEQIEDMLDQYDMSEDQEHHLREKLTMIKNYEYYFGDGKYAFTKSLWESLKGDDKPFTLLYELFKTDKEYAGYADPQIILAIGKFFESWDDGDPNIANNVRKKMEHERDEAEKMLDKWEDAYTSAGGHMAKREAASTQSEAHAKLEKLWKDWTDTMQRTTFMLRMDFTEIKERLANIWSASIASWSYWNQRRAEYDQILDAFAGLGTDTNPYTEGEVLSGDVIRARWQSTGYSFDHMDQLFGLFKGRDAEETRTTFLTDYLRPNEKIEVHAE